LSIVEKWLQKPHVKKYWDDGETWKESYEKYVLRTSSDVVKQFLVYFQNRPIGYIQYYWAGKVGDGWWKGYGDKIVGIDMYIGEEDYLGKGHGTSFLKEFIQMLYNNLDIEKIIIDPTPDNERAIRCYEKVGFIGQKEIETPDGKAYLMEYHFNDV